MKIPSRETLHRHVFSRDAPLSMQFAKYGACGVIGTLIMFVIALSLSATVIPAFGGMTVDGVPISDEIRQRNHVINNLIAFPFANFITYYLNSKLVFTPGRHSPLLEFTIFTTIAAISFTAGLFSGPLLIARYGIPTITAQITLIITSALVNFICRKFLVFAR